MSLGPITIFDKSALEGLNIDEACWFNNFYMINITPLFFVETLADLEKQVAEGRTPEQVVGNIASKTPPSGRPNFHHHFLCVNDLLGKPIEMRGVPVLAGGRPVQAKGQRGVIFEYPPEMQALQRWEDGDFLKVEYKFARGWRHMLSNLNFDIADKWISSLVNEGVKPHSLEEAKALANQLVAEERNGFYAVRAVCNFQNVPPPIRRLIMERWKRSNQPSLKEFAPYAAHVLEIDIFFYLSLRSSLISKDRPSNTIDIAYLYYLPFCMVFVSNDGLHKRTTPLFLTANQAFVDGAELKADLRRLNEYYSHFSEEIEKHGIMRFAQEPPTDRDFLTSKLWDRFLPGWRKTGGKKNQRSPELESKIVKHLKQMSEGAKPLSKTNAPTADEADYMILNHKIPVRMGRWRLLPPEVEKDQANKATDHLS